MICTTCHRKLPTKSFGWVKSRVRKTECKDCELASLVGTEPNKAIETAVKLLGAVP